jgi:hypothetical protein
MPLEIAQQNLGHASLNTTIVYVTTEAKRRMQNWPEVLDRLAIRPCTSSCARRARTPRTSRW